MNEQSNTKLGEIFTNLKGLDLEVEKMDLSVRSYNLLKRAGVNNLRELLSVSENDLIHSGKVPRCPAEVITKLQELSERVGFNGEKM